MAVSPMGLVSGESNRISLAPRLWLHSNPGDSVVKSTILHTFSLHEVLRLPQGTNHRVWHSPPKECVFR